jgi:hypothetical protein
MKKHLFVLLLIFGYYNASAQMTPEISVQNRTFIASDSLLPFWFMANQNGKVRNVGSLFNLTDIYLKQPYHEYTSGVNYTFGINALAGFGESSYYQLNQVFGGVSWKGWDLKAGKFHDPSLYAGLSTTNGNLARSQNARPYPKVRFGNLTFKPVPLSQNRLRYKVEYSEGLLNDARYVKNTRLHHKSFYLRAHLSPTMDLEAGLEHFVLWGGTSPEESIGKMPSGLKDYIRYISGTSGDQAFPETDQRNVAGNQLGTWQFQVHKRFPEMGISFYLSHLFEELSGLKWRNWPDNLLGLYINLMKKEQLITDVVYEYTNTRQQSILDRDDDPDPGNYYRHGIYRSSFTYHQQMMGSPLFFPVILQDGIARGLGSNRFYAHHLGVKGKVTDQLEWKGLFTFIHHFGLYNASYEPSERQLSGHLEVLYMNSVLPVDIGMSIAADAGKTTKNNYGVLFMMSRNF